MGEEQDPRLMTKQEREGPTPYYIDSHTYYDQSVVDELRDHADAMSEKVAALEGVISDMDAEVIGAMDDKEKAEADLAEIEEIPDQWLEDYSEDLFGAVPLDADAPVSRDCVSAAMGRHLARRLREEIRMIRLGDRA